LQGGANPPVLPNHVTAHDVLQHLNATIAWYGHVDSVDESTSFPQNALLQDNARQTAKKVVQAAFAFAKAQAVILNSRKNANAATVSNTSGSLARAEETASQRIQKIQSSIEALNQEIGKAHGRTRATLVSQREVLNSDLDFAKQIQTAVQGMASFATGSDSAAGLTGQINLLASSDSVPEALNGALVPASNQKAAVAPVFRVENAGIMELIARIVAVVRARDQVDALREHTSNLQSELNQLRGPLRAQVRELITQSDAIITAVSNETDPAKLEAERQQVSQLAPQFKILSAPVLPLGEQAAALETVQNELIEWRNALNNDNRTALEYLALRLGALALGVVIILIISEAVRRVTFRYVHDARRRSQFVLLRRFVVGFAIAIVVVIGLFNGFGSFATVAGFVTAGLAVALQNVILSVVAYFFLIGRYGLRTGDRVTVSGITGQVIEVGLVRLYLVELAGSGADIHSTGRVAVFSNSIIFQPAALIKQAPGTEFVWHMGFVTLTVDNDYDEARKRLLGAVQAVFKTYGKEIEHQHEIFERTANFQLEDPIPVARVQFLEGACQITIRFPVEISKASETDEEVMRALFKEIDKEPKLKLTTNGMPKIQPVVI
jgi:small-conductance mechanosensitive channel